MGLYGWNDHPTKATLKHYLGGEKPAAVYEVGHSYMITISGVVEGAEPEVTYVHKSNQTSDPRQTLPNMDIRDGEIRIPMTDLVAEALKRLVPSELAQALWQDEDVRREFMYCLKTRYSEGGIEDKDRREFLREIKEAIHDKEVGDLAGVLSGMEFNLCRNTNHYDEVHRINALLRDHNVREHYTREGETEPRFVQFNEKDRGEKQPDGSFKRGALEVAGKAWEEAREYWRTEVIKRFPGPKAEEVTRDPEQG